MKYIIIGDVFMVLFFEISVVSILVVSIIAFVVIGEVLKSASVVIGIIAIILAVIYALVVGCSSIGMIQDNLNTVPICIVNAIRTCPSCIFLYAFISAIASLCSEFTFSSILALIFGVPIMGGIYLLVEGVGFYSFANNEEHPVGYFLLNLADTILFYILFFWLLNR